MVTGLILLSLSSFAQDYKYSVSAQMANFYGAGGKLYFQKNLSKHFSLGGYTHFIPAKAVSDFYTISGPGSGSTLQQDMDVASFGALGSFNVGLLRRVYFRFSASIGGLYYNYKDTRDSFDPNGPFTQVEHDNVVNKFRAFSPDQSEMQLAIGAGLDIQVKVISQLLLTAGFKLDNVIKPNYKGISVGFEEVLDSGNIDPYGDSDTGTMGYVSFGIVYNFGKLQL